MGSSIFRLRYRPACPGDVNRDGAVSLTDLSILLSNFGLTADAQPEQGDINATER